MSSLSKPALQVIKHPLSFALQVLKGFSANHGLLLAGVIAEYELLGYHC